MININDYGYIQTIISEESEDISKMHPAQVARVTAVHKGRYELVCEYGQIYGRLKTSVYYANGEEPFPTTGDFVLIDYIFDGDSRIVKTLERMSFFSRLDPSSKGNADQVLASNFDYVFIMASLNFDFNVKRIERYLTLSWQSGATPVVILTKADLVEDYTGQVEAVKKAAHGVDIYAVSAKTGYGISELKDYLKPRKTVVLLGSSGVGKSSLVNSLAGENIMLVNEIREDDSRGRHTTTYRQLIMLKSGVMIIDTPGMRELGMWDVSSGLLHSFSDVELYFTECKFSDCKHQSEPGCAVNEAIENGSLTKERLHSYLKLKKEAKYSDMKARHQEIKQHTQQSYRSHAKDRRKNKITDIIKAQQ